MPCEYIGLFEGNARRADLLDALFRMRIRAKGKVGPMTIFASETAAVASLPGGGLCIGDLHDHRGRKLDPYRALLHQPRDQTAQQYLTRNFWGAYLLFLPVEDDGDAVSVTRDPSGALNCAFLKQGPHRFVTSSVGIAVALGLYRSALDWEFIAHCLTAPHLKVQRCGLEDVGELLPGNTISLAAQSAPDNRLTWTPWPFLARAQQHRNPADAASAVRDAVEKVIHAFAAEDQSVLLELSGGLDSSIVGACLARTSARVTCFTAVTPLRGADERRYAELIAKLLDVELQARTLNFEDAQISFGVPAWSLRPAVWALGHAVSWVMDEAADQAQVDALFSGGGGDTVFAYLTTVSPAADAFRVCGLKEGVKAIGNLSRLHGCTLAKATWLTLRKLYKRPTYSPAPDHRFLNQDCERPALESHPWLAAPPDALAGDRERVLSLIGTQLFADATPRSGGRRVRMPLLAQPVVEACLRVPSWMWIAGGRNRAVARDAFSDDLPEAILNRRSKGTFMNYTASVYRRNRQAISDFLLDGELQSQRLLDRAALERYLQQPPVARDDTFMRIFDLCMVENWVRSYR